MLHHMQQTMSYDNDQCPNNLTLHHQHQHNQHNRNGGRYSSTNATTTDYNGHGNKFETSTLYLRWRTNKSLPILDHETTHCDDTSSISSGTFIEPNAIIFNDSDIIINSVALIAPTIIGTYDNQVSHAMTNNYRYTAIVVVNVVQCKVLTVQHTKVDIN